MTLRLLTGHVNLKGLESSTLSVGVDAERGKSFGLSDQTRLGPCLR